MSVQIEFDLTVSKDYREGLCDRCHESTTPHIRFFYCSKKLDIHGTRYGNSLIDIEIEVCEKCASHVNRRWRSYLD